MSEPWDKPVSFVVNLPRYEFQEFISGNDWRPNSIQTTVCLATRNSSALTPKVWSVEMERVHNRFFNHTKLIPIKRWSVSEYQTSHSFRILFDELTPYNYLRLYYTALVLQKLGHFSQPGQPSPDVWIESVTAIFGDRITITR